jgi:hypothetical protein
MERFDPVDDLVAGHGDDEAQERLQQAMVETEEGKNCGVSTATTKP